MWLIGNSPAEKEEPQQKQHAEAPTVIPPALDPAQLHPMANLNKGLEYLDLESNSQRAEGLIASRGWGEDLSYGTGAVYLMGLATGGFTGLVEGMRSTANVQSPKLRLNAILNSVTRRGPFVGNTAGVLTLTYNVVGTLIDYARGGYHDDAGSLAAGAVTGALYNISRGVKPMLLSSGIVTIASGAWCVIKRAATPRND